MRPSNSNNTSGLTKSNHTPTLLSAALLVIVLAGCGGGGGGSGNGGGTRPEPPTSDSCGLVGVFHDGACQAFGERVDTRVATPFVEDGQPVELEVVIAQPFGPGPFPALMFNHGSTGNGSDPSLFGITFTSRDVARHFVERGWLVAFPQRRGRGRSDGLYDEGFAPDRSGYSCRASTALAGADRALEDLDVLTDWLRGHPAVNPSRLVVSGTSRGGILAIAHAARQPDVYLGAINFVGGWLGEGCGDYREVNRALFVSGATFPGASLWLYGANDTFYSLDHSRSNHDAFLDAGGSGELNIFMRAAGLNGHFLINDRELWDETVSSYLEQL